MITAEEYLDSYKKEFNENGIVFDYSIVLRRFAKLHVQEALKAVHKNMQLPIEDLDFILNSYPLTNIK